jgi:uncharacterized pyridoxamine 5'-phosphate oxidase family protein
MRSLEYTEMRAKIIDRLKEQKNVVLATCENGKVTARTVYCTSNDRKPMRNINKLLKIL